MSEYGDKDCSVCQKDILLKRICKACYYKVVNEVENLRNEISNAQCGQCEADLTTHYKCGSCKNEWKVFREEDD